MKSDLPHDLNIKDFWRLPVQDWKNITKYDFHYILQTLDISKDKAHLAYKDDIQKLQNGFLETSRRFELLESCKAELKNISNNKTNKFFWKTHSKKIGKLALDRMVNEVELANVEQSIAIKIMKKRNNPTEEDEEEKVDEQNRASKRRSNSLEDKFLAFRHFSARCASSGNGLSIESQIYELLALKNIILLKPFQYSEAMRNYFENKTLNRLYTELSKPLYGDKQSFDPSVASLVSDAVYRYTQSTENIDANPDALMKCVRKLILMSADRPRCEASILFGLANLLQKLPFRTMMEGVVLGETELWSSAFDPILSAILSNPEKQVILRWSNVIPPEGSVSHIVQVRPDALVCEINQLSWGKSLGFGEVKLREPRTNLDAVGCDLLRLADLTQDASARQNASFSFQIHGYNLKAYITTTIPNTSITAMLEILSLEFPKSVNDLPSFVSRQSLDKLVRLHEVFWNNCLEEKNDNSSQESTLDIAVLHGIKQCSPDRSRKNTS